MCLLCACTNSDSEKPRLRVGAHYIFSVSRGKPFLNEKKLHCFYHPLSHACLMKVW